MTPTHAPSVARFLRLLAAEREANARTLASIESVPAERRHGDAYARALGLLPHNTLARRVWLHRLKGEAYEPPTDWFPAWPTAQTAAAVADADEAWGAFVRSLSEEDLARVCEYASVEGVRYASTFDDVLTHVFNHSTYHRGQIARIVHELGGKRAATDYIALTRRRLP